jgi:hypothetical protein
MSRVRCEHVRELAPELALGLLTGRERAGCLAHLEDCGACRAEVSALAVTADDVLLAGPRATPPPGFEHRVLRRLDVLRSTGDDDPAPVPAAPILTARSGRRRRSSRPSGALGTLRLGGRRWLAAAALVLVVAAVGVAGVGRLAGPGGPDEAAAATAEMRTGTGHLVGGATVRGDDPAVVTVELPGWSELVDLYGDAGSTYWVAVELEDGSRTMNRIPGGTDQEWEVPLRAAAGDVAAVSVVDGEGRAWCTGRFPS